jgi:uncharacterized membrane protein YoaT (DUF817 family)
MSEQRSGRFSWLSWQPIRWSKWLQIYLSASVPFVLVPALFIEMHHNGGHFVQAYQTLANQEGAYRVVEMLVFVDWAFLVWLTFFSKSKMVTDSDKLIVFIGDCTLLVLMGTMVVRSGYLARIF